MQQWDTRLWNSDLAHFGAFCRSLSFCQPVCAKTRETEFLRSVQPRSLESSLMTYHSLIFCAVFGSDCHVSLSTRDRPISELETRFSLKGNARVNTEAQHSNPATKANIPCATICLPPFHTRFCSTCDLKPPAIVAALSSSVDCKTLRFNQLTIFLLKGRSK